MKRIGIWSALLAASLVATYLVYYGGEEAGDDDDTIVAIYRADADDVQSIRWAADDLTLDVQRKSDERGEYYWVELEETVTTRIPIEPSEDEAADEEASEEDVPVEPADEEASEDEAGEGEGEGDEPEEPEEPAFREETEVRTAAFKGNEAAEKLWESFSPLHGLRDFGPLDDHDASVFGLDEPTATLTIGRRSGQVELVLGGETYGSKDRYVQYDGRTYLVDDASLRPLQYGKTRLVDRELLPYKEADAAEVLVVAGSQQLALVQENKDDRGAAYWAQADTPETADDAAGTWLGKVFRMRVQNYVSPDEVQGVLEPRFSYVVRGDDGDWKVEILQEAGEGDFYARSDYGRGLVKLTTTLASEAVADLETVLPEE